MAVLIMRFLLLLSTYRGSECDGSPWCEDKLVARVSEVLARLRPVTFRKEQRACVFVPPLPKPSSMDPSSLLSNKFLRLADCPLDAIVVVESVGLRWSRAKSCPFPSAATNAVVGP